MSGRKGKANVDAGSVLTQEEKILKEVHDVYVIDNGPTPLKDIMVDLELKCLVPRKRVNVMLIGNHSAGKSSFVNWYIDDKIQKTGVAIETSGFTIVHSGKKKDVWKGQATIEYFDWLEGVGELGEHVEENIRTEICSSKNRQFTSVNFIDSPGLTDGQMEYPYPVDEVILFFAEHCDLVLVFFDPIGQALCERTMMVVEQLNDRCPDKVSYYCSKADTITDGNDRQKVLIQITQNLSGRIKNPHTFDIPTIYLPTEAECDIPNNIEDVCKMIDSTISAAVQNSLNNLKTDCDAVKKKMLSLHATDELNSSSNTNRSIAHWLFFLAFFLGSLSIPLMISLNKLERAFGLISALAGAIGDNYGQGIAQQLLGLSALAPIYFSSLEEELKGIGMALVVLLCYYITDKLVFGWLIPAKPTFTKEKLKTFEEYKSRCAALMTKRSAWYKEYQEIAINKEYD